MPPILASAQAPATSPETTEQPGHRPAASVHERVLATVAARICASSDRSDDGTSEGGQAQRLEALCDAVVTSDAALDGAFAQLRRQHGVTDEELVDCHIPAAACQLGTDWSENRRSFAEVTIGTARLIAAVRRLGERWIADTVADWRAPNMAMVVPEAEQHRLGAMIAASQFRRLGVSVQMLIGRPEHEVIGRISEGGFDFVSFSLATREGLEQTRRLIQMLRKSVIELPPIVVGGALGSDAEGVRAQLGADVVACDPKQALSLCGISVPPWPRGTSRANA